MRTLRAVDVRRPLADEPTAHAARAAQVLFIDTWDANDRPNMSLTSTPGDERAQQLAEVYPISLRSMPAPTRVNHEAVDATRFQEARDQKAS
jgi:hypothetical protein